MNADIPRAGSDIRYFRVICSRWNTRVQKVVQGLFPNIMLEV